jgi:hypothetical protein
VIDLFLSYARPDRTWVNSLADAIAADGWRVWWDREIPPGASFQQAISKALEEARCVTVIWSGAALQSDWVLAEASRGRDRSVLMPILKERVVIPVPFNLIQSVDLSDWQGEHQHAGLSTVKSRYSAMLGEPERLSWVEAVRLINQFVRLRRIEIADMQEAEVVSSSGARAYYAVATDGLGVVYCHATGAYRGQVFYVRRGISIFFHEDHGGPSGALGLPVSNEELADGSSFPTSYFEKGLIEWSSKTWEAQAYLAAASGREKLGSSRKV